jgi:hypothetical protein
VPTLLLSFQGGETVLGLLAIDWLSFGGLAKSDEALVVAPQSALEVHAA